MPALSKLRERLKEASQLPFLPLIRYHPMATPLWESLSPWQRAPQTQWLLAPMEWLHHLAWS